MDVILLEFIKPLKVVDGTIPDHVEYLDKYNFHESRLTDG